MGGDIIRKADYEKYDNLFPDICDSVSFGMNCSLCNRAHNFVGKDIILGNGPCEASHMVVGKDSAGEHPNERLWKGSRCTRIPLTNKKSGAKIRIMLYKAGIDPSKVFFTNTVKCNVGSDKFGEKAYKKVVKFCIPHLLEEIRQIKPKVIICLGKISYDEVYEMLKNHETGVSLENCKRLDHPSRVEGCKKELEYIEMIKHII